MANEQFMERAVEAVAAYFEAQLPTHLRAVETARTLSAQTLADPVAYLRSDVAQDLRSPLVQVWSEDGEAEDTLASVWSYRVSVALTFTGDVDIIGGAVKARQYLSALQRTAKAARMSNLSGAVNGVIERRHSTVPIAGSNSTQHIAAVELDVTVYESGA
jgi:hypothetical protein